LIDLLSFSLAMNSPSFLKPLNQQTIMLIVGATVFTGAATFYGFSTLMPTRQPVPEAAPQIQQIAALGRIKPVSEVVRVSVPVTLNNDRVAQLLVQRGDRVKVGQVIAILSSRDRLQTALLETQEQVKVAQANLAKVQAGAKQGEITAQQAEIARLEAERQGNIATQTATVNRLASELQNAETEFNRYQSLFQNGAVSASQRDSKQLAFETAQRSLQEAQAALERIKNTSPQELNRARATLAQISEVRPVDVQAAQAEVNKAIAAVRQAEANLAETSVRAPISGQIFEIHARAGETVGSNGIVELGQTEQMEVVTEVYQTDIAKIRQGQSATITSEAFSGTVQGTVHQIGLQVTQQAVSNGTPGENLDRRIVEVRIRLNPEDSKRVSALTNLQVQVAIKL
jgi:HlyD family secretion protein